MSRADKTSPLQKKILYSDFLINFDQNPVTGFLAKVTNEDAIKNSLRNLIMTDIYERPYQPHVGCKVRSLLFEPVDDITAELLRTTILQTCRNEPRAIIHNVECFPDPDTHTYMITILFSAINITEQTSMNLILRRVR